MHMTHTKAGGAAVRAWQPVLDDPAILEG